MLRRFWFKIEILRFDNIPIPEVNEAIVDEIVFDLFSTVHP